jgi:glycosyltransferase involved in cell wall biosynthesis
MLCNQCCGLQISWEVVVADDGSPANAAALNDEVASLKGCRLIKYPENIGRAGIRNFLAQLSHYDTLIYIDAGMMPSERFIDTYVRHIGKADVVVGSLKVAKEHIDLSNLRCKNELRAERRSTIETRNASAYTNFHSGNFMIRRQAMLDNPFRSEILTYGYEDTLFGKDLADKHVSILHIDNPLCFVRFESNERFLEKTKEAMLTLYTYREELKGYSGLLDVVERLQRFHMLRITVWISRWIEKIIMRNLLVNHRLMPFYNLYRIMCLARLFYE